MTEMINEHEESTGCDLVSQIAEYRMTGRMTRVTIAEMLSRTAELESKEVSELCKGTQLCFYIPYFQRGLKWSDEQKSRFIENLWLGRTAGALIATGVSRSKKTKQCHPFSNMLLDGQQRVNAVASYLNDEVEAFGFVFSELDAASQEHFYGISLNVEVFSPATYSEETFAQMYDDMNFSGTIHDEAERAIADRSGVFFITHDDEGNLIAMNGKGETREVVDMLHEADNEYALSSVFIDDEGLDALTKAQV